MFRHVVIFRWNESSTPAHRAELEAALSGLPEVIPELRGYHVGADAGINPGNADFAVVAEFDDAAGYLAYRDHPEHTRIITELIAPYVDTRSVVQFDSAN